MSTRCEFPYADNVCVIKEQGILKRKFNLKYSYEGVTDISKLFIVATAMKVHVKVWDRSYIGFKMYGKSSCDVSLYCQKEGKEKLLVTPVYEKDYWSGDLTLEAYVPSALLENLAVQVKYGDILSGEGVNVNDLYLFTRSGNVTCKSTFKKGFIKTLRGQLTIDINVKNNIALEANTFIGDIDLTLKNVKKIIADEESQVKDFSNYHKFYSKGYTLKLLVKAIKGSITLN